MAAGYFARLCLAGSAALLLGITGPALAQGYIGAGVGQTAVDICDDLTALGVPQCDDKDTGVKIFGGYNINQNFGVEAAWMDLGEVSASGGGTTATAELDGFSLAGVGMFPINQDLRVFGKVGLFMWDVTGGGAAAGISEDGTDLMFGAGVGWNFMRNLGVRAEWERFDVDGDNVDFLSVGVQFNF